MDEELSTERQSRLFMRTTLMRQMKPGLNENIGSLVDEFNSYVSSGIDTNCKVCLTLSPEALESRVNKDLVYDDEGGCGGRPERKIIARGSSPTIRLFRRKTNLRCNAETTRELARYLKIVLENSDAKRLPDYLVDWSTMTYDSDSVEGRPQKKARREFTTL